MPRRVIAPEQFIGQTFGNFSVLSVHEFRDTSSGHIAYVDARCKCGTVKVLRLNSLKTGRPATCGCGRQKVLRTDTGEIVPEYEVWLAMRQRCTLNDHPSCERYGHRGIRICDAWMGEDGFRRFMADMGPRPSPTHEIDRIDNDGNYEPSNCRWATIKQNARNRSSTRWITMFGRTMCASEWAELFGMDRHSVGRYVQLHNEQEAEKHFSAFAHLLDRDASASLQSKLSAEPSEISRTSD